MGKGGDGSAVMRQRKTPSVRTKPGPSARRETRDLAPKTPVQKLKNDITVLKHIWFSRVTETDHAARLEQFYAPQAAAYDSFRSNFLWGRKPMLAACAARVTDLGLRNLVWVDLGGGTGENVKLMSRYIDLNVFKHIYVVDLCSSLCEQAKLKVKQEGWSNVTVVEGDATAFTPPKGASADLVTFSYSLSMIPPFYAAVDRAASYLTPETGILGVTDFYVGAKSDLPLRKMTWLRRFFWRATFDTDHIDVGPERRQYLDYVLSREWEHNSQGSIPYVPYLRAPYYIWIGRRRSSRSTAVVEAKVERPPAFPPTFLYTQSWEDPAVDAPFLAISPDDVCLTLTSGGCNSLELCIAGAREVYSVDCNPAQSALLEAKAVAIRRLPYEDVWKLFGEGKHPDAARIFERDLVPFMSEASIEFWSTRTHYFNNGLYYYGGMGHVVWLLRFLSKVLGLASAVARIAEAPSLAEQRKAADALWSSGALALVPNWFIVFFLRLVLFNPISLWLGAGVPKRQRNLIAHDNLSVADYAQRGLHGILYDTHLKSDNYFYYNCLTGRFTPTNCPRYLRADGYRTLRDGGAVYALRVVSGYFQPELEKRTYTKVILMDHLDWLPQEMCESMAKALGRHVAKGGRVIWRSAAERPPYADLIAKAGFKVDLVHSMREVPYMDRVNTYASFYVATKL